MIGSFALIPVTLYSSESMLSSRENSTASDSASTVSSVDCSASDTFSAVSESDTETGSSSTMIYLSAISLFSSAGIVHAADAVSDTVSNADSQPALLSLNFFILFPLFLHFLLFSLCISLLCKILCSVTTVALVVIAVINTLHEHFTAVDLIC